MKKLFASTKSKVITGVVAVLLLLCGAAAGTVAYFGSHSLPGSTIAGHDVGGQSREQVTNRLQALIDGQVVGIEVPGGDMVPVDYPQAGISVDIDQTVDQVFARNGDLADRIEGLFSSNDVPPVLVVDNEQLRRYVEEIEFTGKAQAVDASVSFDNDSKKFVIAASSEGTIIDSEVLTEELVAAALTLDDATLEAVSLVDKPDVATTGVEEAAETANKWVETTVETTDADGWVEQPEPEVIAGWIKFEVKGDSVTPAVDKEAVGKWVNQVAEESKLDPVPGIQNVNSAGTVVAIARDGSRGRQVSNVDQVVDGIVNSLDTQTSYSAEFEYSYQDPTFEQRLIASGAENLVYQAAPGERWIDVNMSTYTATAYEGTTAIMSIPTVFGAPATPTKTGTFAVYAKVPIQDMKGFNPDGTPYLARDMSWILYYDGDYALHGTPVRYKFGYDAGTSGSKGCVNLPVDRAKQLYDWAGIGDRVIVHY